MPDNGSGKASPVFRPRAIMIAALPLLLFIALAVVFLKQLLSGTDTSQIPSALIGRTIPEFALEPLPGLAGPSGPIPPLTTSTLKGQVAIVNVWASWCAPCRLEHPYLMELSRQDGYSVTGINYKDQPENALRFLGQLGNPFSAVGIDPRGKAVIDWGVYGVPETFIVAANGTIAHKHVGPLTPEALVQTFLPALRAAIAARDAK